MPMRLLAAAATLALLVGLLFLGPFSAGSSRAPSSGARGDARGRDAGAARPGAEAVDRAGAGAASERFEVALVDAAGEPAPTGDGRTRLRVTALVVDARGEPVAEAVLVAPAWRPDAVLARAGADGRIDAELAFDPRDPSLETGPGAAWTLAKVAILADGHVGRRLFIPAREGVDVRLGRIALADGVPVFGRVLDAHGRGVADALVRWHAGEPVPFSGARSRAIGTMPADERFAEAQLEARSDADGAYRLPGVPLELGFVEAFGAPRPPTCAALPQARGTTPIPLDLVLRESTARLRTLRGRVTGPDGAPEAGAKVDWTWLEGSFEPWAHVVATSFTDADGAFELIGAITDDDPRTWIEVDDANGELARETVVLEPLVPEVDVRLRAALSIEVALVDAGGRPIRGGCIGLDGWDGPIVWSTADPDGTRALTVRDPFFRVLALAPDFVRTETGELDAQTVGPRVEIVMAPGRAIRGRVVAADRSGAPIAGARVGVAWSSVAPGHTAIGLGATLPERGFALRGLTDVKTPEVLTDADGAFALALPGAVPGPTFNNFTLVVHADGYARRGLGPFAWTQEQGASGLLVALDRPGAIEGRVLVDPGRDAALTLVAASDGYGVAWTTSADAEGRFRLEGLPPGPIQLREGVAPLAAVHRLRIASRADPTTAPTWDGEVRAGETARLDLDLRGVVARAVRGRWLVDGEHPGYGAQAELFETGPDGALLSVPSKRVDLGPGGTFEFSLTTAPPYQPVLLRVHQGMAGEREGFEWLDLPPGETAWEHDVATGDLRCAGPRPMRTSNVRHSTAVVRRRAPSGPTWFFKLRGRDWHGAVPVGELDVLVHRDRFEGGHPLADETWIPLGSVRVAPGVETAFELR